MQYKLEMKIDVPDDVIPSDWAEKFDFTDKVQEWAQFHLSGGRLTKDNPLNTKPFNIVNGSIFVVEL